MILLAITIDTECDKDNAWNIRRPLSFGNVRHGIPERLTPLFHDLALRPTYLLSPEVLQDPASVDVLLGLDNADFGTHLHAEFVEPASNLDARATDQVQGGLPPDLEQGKLESLTQRFEQIMGARPTSFRAGRFGLSSQTLTFLEQLKYTVDCSVTPNLWHIRKRQASESHLGAPLQPYHPDANDFRKPGGLRLWEVPVTITNPLLDRLPRVLLRSINPLGRIQASLLARTCTLLRARTLWLRPSFSNADEMGFVAARAVARDPGENTVLCMMFHSNEATAGTSPYNATEGDVERFLDRIRTFVTRLRTRHTVQSLGLSEAPGILSRPSCAHATP